jgi:hypothetical protein
VSVIVEPTVLAEVAVPSRLGVALPTLEAAEQVESAEGFSLSPE